MRPFGNIPGVFLDDDGQFVDEDGNALDNEAVLDLASTPTNEWTWGDVRRQNERNAKEMGWQAGAGGLSSLAQVALGAIPTSTDTRNAERLAVLQEAESAGRLGLTADERSQLESQVLTPARQIARQAEEDTGRRLAAMPTASLATQQALQQANAKAAQDAAVKAGIAMGQANLDAKRQQQAELESRLKDKAEKEAATIDTISQSIGSLAALGGKIAAGQTQKRGLSDADLTYFATAKTDEGKPMYEGAYGKDPETIRKWADRQKAWDIQQGQEEAKRAKKQKPLETVLPEFDDNIDDGV